MTSFRKFLEEQEQAFRAEVERNGERIDRWIRCVSELVELVTRWLEEDDSPKLLNIESKEIDVNEDFVGIYRVSSLTIHLGSRAVNLIPIACRVMGPMTRPQQTNWLGRVDLAGSYVYHLYCKMDQDDEPSWVAVRENSSRITPFTREFFEAAMVELFS